MLGGQKGVEMRTFFPIRTDQLIDNTQAFFDVYTLPEKKYSDAMPDDFVVYAKAPYRWTLRELNELMKLGIQDLYVEERQRDDFVRYRALKVDAPPVDEELEARFRIRQVQDVAVHLLEAATMSDVSPELSQKLRVTASQVIKCLMEDPRCVQEVQMLCEHSLYTYVHSAGVGILTPAIALQMGEKDPEMLTLYSLAGLLHDIGKKHVPLNVLDKSGPLTPEEWGLMKEHPALGVESLVGLGLPEMILEVVGLHHEKIDGTGYPSGLRGEEIPEWVQIATVADIFSALSTTRCYHFKRSRFEALMFMKHEMRGKISREAFRALVASLVMDGTEDLKAA